MNRLTRPVVELYRDIPWCHWKQIHKPDAVGRILILFGVFYLLYAFSLTGDRPTDRTRQGLVVALQLLPLWGWSIAWALAGLACIGSAVLIGPRPGWVGFTAAWAPPMGWAVWYLVGLFTGAPGRGLVSAMIFASFALLAFLCAYVIDPRTTQVPHE